jgi:diguanylate cyclase (GGDEF)-like protein
MLFYISSNACLYFIEPKWFRSFCFFSTLVVFDTLALSFSLIASRQLGSDLYLTYFLIVLIASFWKDFRWSLGFGVLISLLYTYLLFIGESLNAYMALRVPFLFIASVFYGYCTQVVCTERTLREKAENEVRKDFLTGLWNRQGFEERVKEETERARRYGRPLSLLMIDIDDFKAINDRFGHPSGDAVLQKVASVLKSGVREPDFVARIGGEEFVMLLPETDLTGATEVAHRICSEVEKCVVESPEGPIRVTVSVGTSSDCCNDESDFAQIVCNADKALYVAKQNGKNRVEEFAGLFNA